MKAVLMAAGVGSRISRNIDRPKSLLDVGGEPLIVRTVRMLKARGADVAVVVGYRYTEFHDALSDLGAEIIHNPFFRVTNSLGSLWFARDFMDADDTVLMNADVYMDEEILDMLLDSPWDITVATDDSKAVTGDFCYRVEEGLVTMYGKELTDEQRTTESVGIAFVKAGFMPTFMDRMDDMVTDEKYTTWWDLVLYDHMDSDPIHAMDVSGLFWTEVDYIEDYNKILKHIAGE